MSVVHAVVGGLVVVLFSASAALGAWRWWQGEASERFWTLVRAGQGVLVVQVVLGGVLLAAGREPADLHLLYGLLPLAISFVAEQLRVSSAEAVLADRGLEGSDAVRALPEDDQRTVVFAIVRRELGVMTLASLTIAGLALRAGLLAL